MKTIILFLVSLTVVTVAQAHNVSQGRYGRPEGHASLSVFVGQPAYSGEACLNGFGHKKAGDLGFTGRRVYNEMDHSAEIVPLNAEAWVWYDTATMEVRYIDGCTKKGKPYKNRIKFVEQPKAAPTPEVITKVVYVPVEHTVVKTEVVHERPRGHFVCQPVYACVPRCVPGPCGRMRRVMERRQVGMKRVWVNDGPGYRAPNQPYGSDGPDQPYMQASERGRSGPMPMPAPEPMNPQFEEMNRALAGN